MRFFGKDTFMNNQTVPTGKNAAGQSAAKGLDLAALFGAATQALASNQASLNQADVENGNHGDNMVQTFNMITQALSSQQGASPSQQLNHASQVLSQHGTSGSAQVYSQGLAQAAQQYQGQPAVTSGNVMTLIQSLLGGGQSSAPQEQGGGDLLGTLLGGGGSSASQGGAGLLGSLLGGGQTAQQGQGQEGLDLGDLLNAGMAFMNARQHGQNNMQAALSALVAAGPMGQKPHRQESGQLVANALLQAVAAMTKR
jgi:hypothetical protein